MQPARCGPEKGGLRSMPVRQSTRRASELHVRQASQARAMYGRQANHTAVPAPTAFGTRLTKLKYCPETSWPQEQVGWGVGRGGAGRGAGWDVGCCGGFARVGLLRCSARIEMTMTWSCL